MPPTNPAVLTPSCEAAPVLVWSLLLAVVVAVAMVALTELGGGLVELLLVSM
jgi:hypothetical protein